MTSEKETTHRSESIALIAFTRRGCALACDVARALADSADGETRCSVCGPARFADDLGIGAYESLESWTAEHVVSDDALLFVSAAGIAVRAIAPHVRDKFTDPAVVSVDEAGRFAVPLLSGHVGGANDLARAVARITGGQAVVSTATDVNGLFAVDEWAARHGFAIGERALAKEVSAALLEGRPVGFKVCDGFDVGDDMPRGVTVVEEDASAEPALELGFVVSLDDAVHPFARTLHLVPRCVTVGIGCRRGTHFDVARDAVLTALAHAHIAPRAVTTLASIDVKADEQALHELAAAQGWSLAFYSADELAALPGDFTPSAFVKKTVGVDNVCERAACAAGGRLVLGKQAHDGVTVALAVR